MPLTRRDFLKRIGAGAASLAAAWILEGCRAAGVPVPTPTRAASTPPNPTPTITPAPTPSVPPIAARLSADVSRLIGTVDGKLWANIGFDPMFSHTTAPATQPVWDLIRESRAFRYIRCHNTFSDAQPGARPDQTMGCRVYSEDAGGAARCNFQYLDQVLDTWCAVGVKPILEMDFMPDALADGAIVRNYSGGAINAPRDFGKWREMIFQTVKHCLARYGADAVRSWYFEIWNEPDLSTYFVDGATPLLPQKFTAERLTRFNKMYDYFVDGATAADAQIKVGGPGLAGHDDFLKVFLDHITSGTNAATGARGTRADFISWHVYDSSQGVLNRNRARRAMVRSYPALANAELLQDEWGQKLRLNEDGRTPTVMNEYDTAFLCRTIDNNLNSPDASVDLFLRWGQVLNGWRALTQRFGDAVVPLPIFNAYALLGKLGVERVAIDNSASGANVRAFAARRGTAAQIVVYRFDETDEDGAGAPVGVELTIKGIAGSTVSFNHYRIDREHGNAYRAWVALGRPKNPTSAQAAEIAAKAKLTPETATVSIENGAARL
ncbi:MAG: twin-arginine translocation signal domain-containing protein, partial [Chloroflexota bacterium]|nr:twin-arginine translocation signal domain-containing protein [Chloroflexota bacterium]